jgi:hypothetical protein
MGNWNKSIWGLFDIENDGFPKPDIGLFSISKPGYLMPKTVFSPFNFKSFRKDTISNKRSDSQTPLEMTKWCAILSPILTWPSHEGNFTLTSSRAERSGVERSKSLTHQSVTSKDFFTALRSGRNDNNNPSAQLSSRAKRGVERSKSFAHWSVTSTDFSTTLRSGRNDTNNPSAQLSSRAERSGVERSKSFKHWSVTSVDFSATLRSGRNDTGLDFALVSSRAESRDRSFDSAQEPAKRFLNEDSVAPRSAAASSVLYNMSIKNVIPVPIRIQQNLKHRDTAKRLVTKRLQEHCQAPKKYLDNQLNRLPELVNGSDNRTLKEK